MLLLGPFEPPVCDPQSVTPTCKHRLQRFLILLVIKTVECIRFLVGPTDRLNVPYETFNETSYPLPTFLIQLVQNGPNS